MDTSKLQIGRTGKRKTRWKDKLNWRGKRAEGLDLGEEGKEEEEEERK